MFGSPSFFSNLLPHWALFVTLYLLVVILYLLVCIILLSLSLIYVNSISVKWLYVFVFSHIVFQGQVMRAKYFDFFGEVLKAGIKQLIKH